MLGGLLLLTVFVDCGGGGGGPCPDDGLAIDGGGRLGGGGGMPLGTPPETLISVSEALSLLEALYPLVPSVDSLRLEFVLEGMFVLELALFCSHSRLEIFDTLFIGLLF